MTRRIRTGATAAVATVLTVLTVLAGCHSPSPAEPSGLSEAQVAEILQEYTQCMRDHGVPGFQPPRLVNGRLHGGGAAGDAGADAMKAASDACEPIAKRLPDSMWGNQDPTAAELDTLRRWADCLRQHGFPDWPDPDSRGRFAIIGTPMEHALKGDGAKEAIDACRQYSDGAGVRLTSP